MIAPGAPVSLLATRLAAPPAAAWPRVAEPRFLAGLLGLPAGAWPAQALHAGTCLRLLDGNGQALTLTVRHCAPPHELRLELDGAQGRSAWQLLLQPGGGGSRLTVLQEAAGAADDALDGVAALLRTPLPAALQLQRVADAAGLRDALAHLEGTAQAVRGLLGAMAPHQGRARPASGGFSLVEHLWHLADLDELGWLPRFTRLLREDEPRLAGVDGDRLALERRYQLRPWRGAARRFLARRRALLRVLAGYREADLARPAHFEGRGATDAGELLAALLAHDQEHRIDMAALWPPGA